MSYVGVYIRFGHRLTPMARKQLFGCMVALSRNGVYIRFGHHLFGSILSIDRCISLFLWYIHTSAKRGLPDRPVHVLVFTRFGETCVVRSTCYTFRRTVCGLMDLIHVSARRVMCVTANTCRFPDGPLFLGIHILMYTEPFLMIPGSFES